MLYLSFLTRRIQWVARCMPCQAKCFLTLCSDVLVGSCNKIFPAITERTRQKVFLRKKYKDNKNENYKKNLVWSYFAFESLGLRNLGEDIIESTYSWRCDGQCRSTITISVSQMDMLSRTFQKHIISNSFVPTSVISRFGIDQVKM